MKQHIQSRSGLTLVEMMITTVLIGTLGLIIYSLLSTGTILGAKNTAVNTAHQQGRMAILQMTKNLHASASPITLFNAPGDLTSTSFSGISFQLCAGDSLVPVRLCQITSAVAGQFTVTIDLNGNPVPVVQPLPNSPHFIVPGYQFDSVITSVTGTGPVTLTLADKLPDGLTVTDPNAVNVSCFTTDVCSYEVNNRELRFHRPKGAGPGIVVAAGITNNSSHPFQTVNSDASNVKISLSTSDMSSDQYMASRNIKSVTDLLSATIPIKTRLTPMPNASPTATP